MLLLAGCAGPRAVVAPPADRQAILARLRPTADGRRLLAAVPDPIEILYDPANETAAILGGYQDVAAPDGRKTGGRITVHPKLRDQPRSDVFLTVVVAHELTHAAMARLSADNPGLRRLEEPAAYAAAMRVWLELDPRGAPFPRGLAKDFEGRDMSDVLTDIRSSYVRGLPEFTDLIRERYYRLCKSKPAQECGQPTAIEAVLSNGPQSEFAEAWRSLQQDDAAYRTAARSAP